MGIPDDWGMTPPPIPEAYFRALDSARLRYRDESVNFIQPFKVPEDPPIGSRQWREAHEDSLSTRWKEYLLALDGLLDDLESQVWSRSNLGQILPDDQCSIAETP